MEGDGSPTQTSEQVLFLVNINFIQLLYGVRSLDFLVPELPLTCIARGMVSRCY